jgi:hypothetical protein
VIRWGKWFTNVCGGKDMSRPSDFTQELADQICAQLSDGQSLRAVCRQESMPSATSVFNWLRSNRSFLEQYARAKEESADAMADDILDIADDKAEDAQSRRVRIDARKWIASKLKPKRYGDKVETTLTGPDGGPVQVEGRIRLVKPEGGE